MKPQHEIGGGAETEGLDVEYGNQVERSADIIRERFSERAGYLGDAFPRNYNYRAGDYNNVFVSAEEDPTAKPWRYMVLNPDGKIYTGRVRNEVFSSHSRLNFRDARLDEASDLEIIKWGPALEIALRQQLLVEIDEEKDPNKIEKMLNVASATHSDHMVALSSEMALAHMQGVDHIPGDNKTFYQAIEVDREIEIVKRKFEALAMLKRKDEILLVIKENVEQHMRAPMLESDFFRLTTELDRKGIFPYDDVKLERKRNWHLGPPSNHVPKGSRRWAISDEGRAIEVSAYEPFKKAEHCAEHMLLQATQIAGELIDSAIKRFLPAVDLNLPFSTSAVEEPKEA